MKSKWGEWGNQEPKMFVCPKCGREVETIGVSVWCIGYPGGRHEPRKCKEVTGYGPTQNSDDQFEEVV